MSHGWGCAGERGELTGGFLSRARLSQWASRSFAACVRKLSFDSGERKARRTALNSSWFERSVAVLELQGLMICRAPVLGNRSMRTIEAREKKDNKTPCYLSFLCAKCVKKVRSTQLSFRGKEKARTQSLFIRHWSGAETHITSTPET